ncbi:MAG: Glutathione S-transferase [Ramlibacter sp.]|jgi:glutathione S-transferase|nr:Glutathione S-transferase [Ramlibacter sp.]
MALELYAWPRSSASRITWALAELGVPYRYIELDQGKKEHLAPAYLAINPHGKVPALVDDDQRLFESLAILLHLGDKYGVEKGLWPSAGRPERADALCWTVWSTTELGTYMLQYMYHGMDSPVSYAPADRSAACAAYNRSQLDRCLGALDARLAGRAALVGNAFSLADLAVASTLAFGTMCGLTLDAWPHVVAWLEHCTSRPARQQAR